MDTWKSVQVSPNLSLESAINVLDRGSLRIVLVVDKNGHLLGTLTDGDVRRALIQHMPLDTTVQKIMCVTPKVGYRTWSNDEILAFMSRTQLLHLPIVDPDGRVVGLETLHGVLNKPRRDNPVFLMAGGFGKRLHPLTDSCPKPLLKVGDKPILELILDSFIAAGFHRFYISTHYLPEMIHEYFGDGGRWGVEIIYIHETQPLGTAGALGLLPHKDIDKPMFMMNGDLLTNLNYLNLLDFHEEHQGTATMCVRKYEYQVPYGVVSGDGLRITSMEEKPRHSFFINAGIYVLSPALVRGVPKNTRIDMPSLLEQEIAAGRDVNMFPVHEYWLDIGRMDDFRRAQSEVGGVLDA